MIKKTLGILALGSLILAGCSASKKELVKSEPTPAAKVEMPASGSYLVKPGDSLWKIAGKNGTMQDSFRWPLLFKENRDQIEDPDFIYPKQDLRYKKEYTESEIADSVKKAQATPKYQPRTKPRKNLPVKY
jgi:hypothetical protein